MNGREKWFESFKLCGQNVTELATLFQNDFTLEGANQWAKEATQILAELKLTVELAATWIIATKGTDAPTLPPRV